MAKQILSFLDNTIKVYDNIYTYNDLYNMYISNNMTLKDLQEYFCLSEASTLKILKFFNLHKPKDLARHNLEEAMVEKYGVKNCTQVPEIMNKIKKSEGYKKAVKITSERCSKYPGEVFNEYYKTHSFQECVAYFNVSESTISNWIKKYNLTGIKIHQQKKEKEKTYLTTEERVLSRQKAQQKMQETCLQRYGVKTTLLLPEIQEKIKQTNLKRYGFTIATKNEEVKAKIKQNNLNKYGVNVYHQKDIKDFDNWETDDKFSQYVKNNHMNMIDLAQHFNVTYSAINKRVAKLKLLDDIILLNGTSHYETEIITMLKEIGISDEEIVLRDRTILEGKEIDIYLPAYKFGIEFNGDYWHSELISKHSDHNGRSTYHQEKSLEAAKKGVFLFHIFEYEWNNPTIKAQIKNRLTTILYKNTLHLGARKCKIVKLTKQQKKDFLNNNHIQGNDQSNIALGLQYNNTLMACMTFKKSKYKKYNYELSRFCCQNGYNISGGASKLFKYFLDNYCISGDIVVSYNDITKTKGNLYQILKFKSVSINAPNYVWINFETGDIKTRYQTQKAGEIKRMHDMQYYRVCDCGTQTWVYTKG